MNNRDNKNNNNAIVQSAVFISQPSVAFPICDAISVVKLFVVENNHFGRAVVFQITIATASASPNALASPRMIPERIPEPAAGMTTL